MPRLSRYSLTPKQINELAERIIDGAFLLRDRETLALFFQDLLTRTEKAMLGKRILVAMFLEKGYSYKEISEWLKVGENMIAGIRERLEQDGRGFRAVLRVLERKQKIDQFFDRIKKVLDQMPRKNGPRWKFLRSD